MEQGKVWFPKGKPWLDELYAELAMFPYAKHDDQVDVLAYAARQITKRERVRWVAPADPNLRKPSGFGL
jgi:phage terminase large subunit-like protein